MTSPSRLALARPSPQVLEGPRLSLPVDHALDVGQVGPAEERAERHEGAKQDEEQALLGGGRIGALDGEDDQHGQDGSYLAGGGRDAVAGAPIGGGEDLGRDYEGERVGACGWWLAGCLSREASIAGTEAHQS